MKTASSTVFLNQDFSVGLKANAETELGRVCLEGAFPLIEERRKKIQVFKSQEEETLICPEESATKRPRNPAKEKLEKS